MNHLSASASSFEDWEGVHEAVAEAYFPHAMRPLSEGPAGTSAVEVIDLGPCRVTRMSLGATVRVHTDHPGAWAVNTALTGRLEHRVAGLTIISEPELAAVLPPDTPMQLPAWDPSTTLLGFRVDAEFLDREYERVLARRAQPLSPELDLRTAPGRGWLAFVTSALDQAAAGQGLLSDPRMQGRMSELLVAGLLLASTPDDEAPGRGTRPRIVRRVVAAMEDDPARPWTPAELAALAGVSVRRLQQGYREYVGRTPFQYLHDLRLDRAHHDLLHADGSVTVTEVAMRWGLTHTGRFAADYRRRFGQAPSTTLHG